MSHTYTPPGGHIQTQWGSYGAKKIPVPQSPWQPPAQMGSSPWGHSYNVGMPLGNPTEGMVNARSGQTLMQQPNGLWQPPSAPPYPTGFNTGQAWQPQQSQTWPTKFTAPHNIKRGMLAMQQQENDWRAQVDDAMNPKSTLADFARDQVQRNVHNPAIQMYAGLPSMAQSATKSDVDANMGLGNRWQEMAQGRNLQNMNVTLSTEPIEQQLQRYGVAAQAGLGQAGLLRQQMQNRDAFGLAGLNRNLTAARAIYGR